ncbi:hypothetical protein BK664_15595 [Pseudomonas brassicacearum]|uniref:Uncharacterized protein n=1 Tax=Pseudomonas brassicacearum TaxID=930166 RepID=A0A423JJF8_9PSED|nr:hypothetical protein BK664_15595 [Pseudomonas brassicacearum]
MGMLQIGSLLSMQVERATKELREMPASRTAQIEGLPGLFSERYADLWEATFTPALDPIVRRGSTSTLEI